MLWWRLPSSTNAPGQTEVKKASLFTTLPWFSKRRARVWATFGGSGTSSPRWYSNLVCPSKANDPKRKIRSTLGDIADRSILRTLVVTCAARSTCARVNSRYFNTCRKNSDFVQDIPERLGQNPVQPTRRLYRFGGPFDPAASGCGIDLIITCNKSYCRLAQVAT